MIRKLLWKRLVLSGLISGTLLPATIVCDVPAFDVVVEDFYDDSIIIVDDCCYGDRFFFDWWWF